MFVPSQSSSHVSSHCTTLKSPEKKLPFSSSGFFRPTVLGLPRPLRMGSDWLLERECLLFSKSFTMGESMWSRRMRSVLLRFGSNFSEEENAAMMNITSYCKTCMQYFATHIVCCKWLKKGNGRLLHQTINNWKQKM